MTAGRPRKGPPSCHKGRGTCGFLCEGPEKGGKSRLNQISSKNCREEWNFLFILGQNSYTLPVEVLWRYKILSSENKVEDAYTYGRHLGVCPRYPSARYTPSHLCSGDICNRVQSSTNTNKKKGTRKPPKGRYTD